MLVVYPILYEIILNLFAKCCMTKNNSVETHIGNHNKLLNKIPIIYSEDYNITACGLEKCHPFDSCKYRRSNIIINLLDPLKLDSLGADLIKFKSYY